MLPVNRTTHTPFARWADRPETSADAFGIGECEPLVGGSQTLGRPSIYKRFIESRWCASGLFAAFLVLLGAAPSQAATNQFRGVNWADPRDNFNSGVLYLSGLSSSDNNASAKIVADRVISQLVSKLGINAVRLPINEATANTGWSMYTGVIDVALTKGRVVLAYWGPAHGAPPPNMTNWWNMWTTVVNKYGTHKNFYIEIFNEPNMYNKTNLANLYAEWLKKFPSFPQERVILDGTGMAQNVPEIGNDSRFSKCLLAVHDYSMWSAESNTEAQWSAHLRGSVGNFSERTIATEWGAPMSTGSKNGITYQPQDYSSTSASASYFVKYLRGMTEQMRTWKMGSFYWPGLKDNDWYSMTKKTGTGANIELTVSNPSGLARLKYSWVDTIAASIQRSGASPSASPRIVHDRGMQALRLDLEPGSGTASLSLRSVEGRVVKSASRPAGGSVSSLRLDLSGLARGLYVASGDLGGRPLSDAKVVLAP